ncbi:hypothetical protein GCK32_009743 [Trichostrongylus colubriformis]|uniref:Uncharacterized protein n=1 Tax=Trichostrongylus colubriformis TaxID=6319 RepID=A0AAN8G6E7_TRICO
MVLYFHINVKILICGQIVIFINHSFFIVAAQLMHLYKYFFYASLCDVATSAITCTVLRSPLTTSFISVVILQFMMVLERLVAMFRKADYEKSGCLLGTIFLICGVSSAAIATLWSILPEDFSNSYAYCSAGSTQTISRMATIDLCLCIMCALSLIGTLLLRVYNKYALDRKTYCLSYSFHLRENRHIVQMLSPLSFFQAIFLFIFTASGVVIPMFSHQLSYIAFRTIFAASYIIPHYTIITPLMILWIIRTAKRRSIIALEAMRNVQNERELYFSNCSRIWNKI